MCISYKKGAVAPFLYGLVSVGISAALTVRKQKGEHMVNLFVDIPEEIIENTLQTIKRNLDKVNLYGGHTLRRHADIQVAVLKDRLTSEDIEYATSYWDVEVAVAATQSIMRKFYDEEIRYWLTDSYCDVLSLKGKFKHSIGYGFQKGDEQLEEDIRRACLVLVKDRNTDWGFRILTSYPVTYYFRV